MGWNIAWFAIYTTVESLVLIIISSIQEMIGLFLDCELDVKQSVGCVFYFLREAVVYIPVIEGRMVWADYVFLQFSHEDVCKHWRKGVSHSAPINLSV